MPVVIRIDFLNGGEDFLGGCETEQALPRGQYIGKAGVLGDNRLAGSEVCGTSIAEPPCSEANILFLGDRKLASGVAYIVSIRIQILRKAERVANLPSMFLQQILRGFITAA